MNIMDILGGLMQAKTAPSASRRMKNVFGADESSKPSSGANQGFGIEDLLGGLLGGSGSSSAGGGVFGQILNQVGGAVGGNKTLAVGGLSALLGSLLGGGKKAATGALGGGLMALLAAMAMNALQNSGKSTGKVPLGLLAPETEEQQRDLESGTEVVVAAMNNSATPMTIEVDTQAEKTYLRELSSGMGLSRDVVNNIEHMVGMQGV
jgi:uncharacterized membrane protein YebE (DUF533 family)